MASKKVVNSHHGLSPYIGWGISTLLLWLLNRHNSDNESTDSQQASPYTDSNSNQIGQPIPVVLGRVMIKNPLISYYGAFRADIYTEEYGAHSSLNLWPAILLMLIPILLAASQPDVIQIKKGMGKEVTDNGTTEIAKAAATVGGASVTSAGGSSPGDATGGASGAGGASTPPDPSPSANGGKEILEKGGKGPTSTSFINTTSEGEYQSPHGPVTGTAGADGVIYYAGPAKKRNAIMSALINFLLWLIMYLLGKHLLRTTIQKGFKYYLGWQHILCWTDDNVGIKRIWMNVYDSEIEDSTETGVWDNDGHIAYKQANINGIVANVSNWDMFGGPDEGGGFDGQIRFYFGSYSQPKDAWMINQMQAETIPADLRGKTPQYPMFLTCVISNSDKTTGAYIGKQSTIPEMWFEVVNYPSKLHDNFSQELNYLYSVRMGELVSKLLAYLHSQDPSVQNYLNPHLSDLEDYKKSYDDYLTEENLAFDKLELCRERLEDASRSNDSSVIADAQASLDNAISEFNTAHENTVSTFGNMHSSADAIRDNYPQTNRDEVVALVEPIDNLINKGVWSLGKLGEDLNPAEAIYDILTNNLWGCNYDRITDINTYSLVKLGAVCEEEGLGISALITSEAQAGQYIQKILNHINGIMYDDPYTGKLVFKLIRADYSINNLPVFTISNCSEMKFTRIDWSETSSATSVNFTFADNKYDEGQLLYQDVANRFITKSYKENSVDGTYFTTSTNAGWLARVAQLTAGYPLSAIEFTTNRLGHNVTLGSPIIIDWKPYGIDKQVFRVTDIDYATLTSNAIHISAVEDVFGFSVTKYAYVEVPEWTDPKKYATSIQYFMFMELPYERTNSLDTHMYAYAARPSADDIYYVCWRYTGEEYARRNRTIHWSMVAQLVYGTDELYSEDTTGLEIEIIGTDARQMFEDKRNLIINNPDSYSNKSVKNMVCIEDELLTYDNIVALENGHYLLTNVLHGVFDTLPKKHSPYQKVYFMDYGLATDSEIIATEGNFADEQLELRAGTQDEEEEFSLDDIYHYYTKRRSEAPSPMANLKFSADKGEKTEYNYNYPAGTIFGYNINFNYNIRNKFNQSIYIAEQVSEDEQAIPSNNTKYYIKCYSNGKEFEFKYDAVIENEDDEGNITYEYPKDITLYWSDFCENMNNRLMRSNDVTIEIGTYNSNKDLYSFDHYSKQIIWHIPRIVGIILPDNDELTEVQEYADSIVTDTHIEIPESEYINPTTMTFEDAPLIVIAESIDNDGVTGQDGNKYILSTRAYRVDGSISENNAVIHEVELNPEFVIQNDFTRADNITRRYYRYRSGNWVEVTNIYGES